MRVLCIKTDSQIIWPDGHITSCSPLVVEGNPYIVIEVLTEDDGDYYILEEIGWDYMFHCSLFIPTSDRDEVEIMAERSLDKLLIEII